MLVQTLSASDQLLMSRPSFRPQLYPLAKLLLKTKERACKLVGGNVLKPPAPAPVRESARPLNSQSPGLLPQAPPPLTSEPQAGRESRAPAQRQRLSGQADQAQTRRELRTSRPSQPAPRWGSRRYSWGPPCSGLQPQGTEAHDWEGRLLSPWTE